MSKPCPGCGVELPPRRKYCSDRCRKRVVRSPGGVKAAPEVPAPDVGLVKVTERTLSDAGRLDTVLGQQAMALARQIVTPGHTGASVAALSRELREVMGAAMEGVGVKADPVDELKARREAKRNAG